MNPSQDTPTPYPDMKPGTFIDHDDGTSTFVPDTPKDTPSEQLRELEDAIVHYGNFPSHPKRKKLMSLIEQRVHEARIAQIEDDRNDFMKLLQDFKAQLKKEQP